MSILLNRTYPSNKSKASINEDEWELDELVGYSNDADYSPSPFEEDSLPSSYEDMDCQE